MSDEKAGTHAAKFQRRAGCAGLLFLRQRFFTQQKAGIPGRQSA